MYEVKKHKSYKIKGSDGTNYELPCIQRIDAEDVELMAKFNTETNVQERMKLCKEFVLKYAKGLENDPEIGEYEYFMIFEDYNQEYSSQAGES